MTSRDAGDLLSEVAVLPMVEARPWERGYAMARRVRALLGQDSEQPLEVGSLVSSKLVEAATGGMQGLAVRTHNDRCQVALPRLPQSAGSFACARALGRVLAEPAVDRHLLSSVRNGREQVARAFAAELLAPDLGIRRRLAEFEHGDDGALDLIADHYRVSPLVVAHQVDNQLD